MNKNQVMIIYFIFSTSTDTQEWVLNFGHARGDQSPRPMQGIELRSI
jgi:hypothetical protein